MHYYKTRKKIITCINARNNYPDWLIPDLTLKAIRAGIKLFNKDKPKPRLHLIQENQYKGILSKQFRNRVRKGLRAELKFPSICYMS